MIGMAFEFGALERMSAISNAALAGGDCACNDAHNTTVRPAGHSALAMDDLRFFIVFRNLPDRYRYSERRRDHAMSLRRATRVALLTALALSGVEGPALVAAQGSLGTYEDRIAVEDVMARYVWAVDSLDPEGYVAVFTEDAVIDSNGSISKGTRRFARSSPA
jgi:hypothetical protein